MASGHTQTNAQIPRQFQQGLQMLLDTFYDTMLLYSQSIHVVNFSDVPGGFVNVDTVEGVCNGFLALYMFFWFPEFSGYHQWQQESQ